MNGKEATLRQMLGKLSVRQRLVVAIGGSLTLGILGLGSIARWEARYEALASGTARLDIVAGQTADLFANSLSNARTQAAILARDANVRLIAAGARGRERDSAEARLFRVDAASLPIQAIEVWATDGQVLYATTDAFRSVRDTARSLLVGRLADGDSVATGQLISHRDSVAYGIIARVRGHEENRVVVIWRRLVSAQAERGALLRLIGADSRLVLGNGRGVIWSDLYGRVTPPPTAATDSVVEYTRADGMAVLVKRAPITGTLWEVAVEFPVAALLEPADRLTRVLGVAGGILLLLGIALAWGLGRSFGEPIAELVEAAGAVAAGDYSRRAPVRHGGDFGRLARAFNAMAEAIAESRIKLQAHADDLQRRSDALAVQSRQTEDANELLRVAVADAERSRKSLQAALTENARTTAELSAALASAPVAFGFHDAAMRFVRVNERLATFVGRPPSEIVGRLPSEVMPDIGENLESGLARALESGKPILDLELPGSHAGQGGPERQWLATLFPIRTDSGIVGLGSVMLDITDYRLLEQRFLHAQRMEAVGRLAGGIAHDFNNVLTAIGSFNDFAMKELPDGHPAVEDLEQVTLAVERATALIRQLLAFSRHQVMQPVVLDLSEVVRNLLPMLRRLIPESVQLRHDLQDDVFHVYADPVRVEQILVNLVVNAADAMPDGGRLVITTHGAAIQAESANAPPGAKSGRYAVLTVTDSGTGMDDETQARAFEPFFTTKALGHGTGLGLSTVYGIVRQSGGFIGLDSVPGRGTTLTIYLPYHDAPDPARHVTPARVMPRPGRATVLLVEDELLVRLAIRRILASQGHEVIEATDGEAALSILSRPGPRIDLVISDLVMPRLGGRELGERIRARGLSAPILFMSGYTGEFATRQSLLDVSAEFVEKPFSPEALLAKVDELLGASVGDPR